MTPNFVAMTTLLLFLNTEERGGDIKRICERYAALEKSTSLKVRHKGRNLFGNDVEEGIL